MQHAVLISSCSCPTASSVPSSLLESASHRGGLPILPRMPSKRVRYDSLSTLDGDTAVHSRNDAVVDAAADVPFEAVSIWRSSVYLTTSGKESAIGCQAMLCGAHRKCRKCLESQRGNLLHSFFWPALIMTPKLSLGAVLQMLCRPSICISIAIWLMKLVEKL